MTDTDFIKTKESLSVIRYSGILKPDVTIGLHSCNIGQGIAVLNTFPDANLIPINQGDWDILAGRNGFFGLLCFFNIFNYIADPVKAFANVLNSCRYLLVQDLIIRNRSDHIFGDDGDCMRYSCGELKSNFDGAFDLAVLKDQMVFFTPYVEDFQSLHFISLIKGNL